ncbi:MAG TPA: MaoC family dehydratase [Phytomonospora sp.]
MTAATIRAASPAALAETVGQVATGDWFTIGQDRVAAFAEATEDRQWIHLDTQRAAAGPFGTTIAHGFLTLSLLPHLAASLVEVDGVSMAVNYGMDKVRFLSPVPSGSRVRATTEVTAADQSPTGMRLSTLVTVEIDGADRPALVAQTLTLYVPEA